ncbi:hypothetical protein SRABI98_01600 [Microbacterium sp. Bi98]|uniref:DUF3099 domain-containing protein n=1 Tax=unclassified Microbacterium TaxID=2609290 RepID=UPI0006FEED1B|nr:MULTISPECIES: DUF3099 domain-containing protein [unclassified Microbacterium]KRD52395.1 hypothetical protein ASE34_11140 [Microbacterium sp. Root280D1]CAH0184432.1 hypothetical protein SRABI98_01600 [Microbacterium sp. Bi98]
MKSKPLVPAVTSLPQSPKDEADHRVRRYALTMTIRIVCFALMMFVQPYGWYTWVFALAAALLPYIAVVFANAGSDSTETTAESPVQQLEAPAPVPTLPVEQDPPPHVITIHESRQDRE